MKDTPGWTRRISITPGYIRELREDNKDVYDFHISGELERQLDGIISKEEAQDIIDHLNKDYDKGRV